MNPLKSLILPLALIIWYTGGSDTSTVCPSRRPAAFTGDQRGSSHSSIIPWNQRLTLRGGGRLPATEKRARRKQAEDQMKAGIGKSLWRRDRATCLTEKQKRTEKAMDNIRKKAADLNTKVYDHQKSKEACTSLLLQCIFPCFQYPYPCSLLHVPSQKRKKNLSICPFIGHITFHARIWTFVR